MALLLYLPTTAVLLWWWSRRIQRISRGAALALVLLPMVFTGRAILTGRVFAPIDLPFLYEPLKSQAATVGIGEPHNMGLSDLHCQMIPWQKAVRYAIEQGEWPLWNPFILCGDILAAAGQPAVYDPFNLLGLLIPLPQALTFGAAMTFFLAGFFTFVFLRSLGCGDVAALIGAATFMFCGMLSFYVGWPLGRAWALLPLILSGTRRVVHDRKGGLLLAALVLLIVAGHPETILHGVTVGVIYGVFEVIRARSMTPIALAAGAGVLALLLTAIHLLPFAEAVPQTIEHLIRTEMYAPTPYADMAKPGTWKLRIKQTLVPFVPGDPLSARVGYIALLLALSAPLAARRRAETWFFLALAVASVLIMCSIPPLPHVLHELPLFEIAINERFAFAAAFSLAVLAALAADVWFRDRRTAGVLVLALLLVERSIEDGSTYPTLAEKAFYPPVPQLQAIPRDDIFRVAGVGGVSLLPNVAAMYELEDVRGYQAMSFKRLHETYPLWSRPQPVWSNVVDDPGRPFLSFLNIRYFIDETRVTENPRVLPRAFVPSRIRYERDGEAVVKAMLAAADFADLAWIETPSHPPHEIANGPGRLTVRRKGFSFEIDAEMEHEGWIVVSETAWRGWRTYVDERRVRPLFANHAFLGVYVPAGRHRVRLTYLPESFTRGRAISFVTLAGIITAVLFRRFRRRPRNSGQPA